MTSLLQNMMQMRQAQGVNQLATKILNNEEISDEEKMKQLLSIDFLKWGVGAQGNYKLIEFLCQRENLEKLVRYSVAVPTDPDNKDESYKYPMIAHELICHSSMLAEALVEGGWQQEQPDDVDDEEEDDDDLSNDIDDDIEERDDTDTDEEQVEDDANNQDVQNSTEQKKFTQVALKGKKVPPTKMNLSLDVDDDDDEEKKEDKEGESKEGKDETKDETKVSTEDDDDLDERDDTANEDEDKTEDSKTADEKPEESDQAKKEPEQEESDAKKPDNVQDTLSPETQKELKSQKIDNQSEQPIQLNEINPIIEDNVQAADKKEEPAAETAPANKEEASEEVKVSDAFLNLNMQKPSYEKDQQNLQDGDKKVEPEESKEKPEADDDNDDFERDEEDTDGFQAKDQPDDKKIIKEQLKEIDETDAMENVVDEDDKKGAIPLIKKGGKNPLVKVNINVTNIKKAKKNKKKKKDVAPVPKEKKVTYELLDTLFAFIGVSTINESIKTTQASKLNMFTSRSNQSRSTAGTIDILPGPLNDSILGNSAKFTEKIFINAVKPELLPVSCGYFKNIILNILLKQRKMVLTYVLLETKGILFDQLVEYIEYTSLADLLIDLMQINSPVYEPPQKQQSGWDEDDDDKKSDGDEDKEEKKEPVLSPDQVYMKQILGSKKSMVINELISKLSHKNRDDIESSLNAKSVLIDLIETEKTFELFLENDCDKIAKLFELALDPSNSFNQQYLLQILMTVCKQLKPQNQAQNIFKDLDEEGDKKDPNQFDIDSQHSKNLLKFLNIVESQQVLYNLVILINSDDTSNTEDSDIYYMNQYQSRVKKIGQIRLKSLELMHSILVLTYPTLGHLAAASYNLSNTEPPKAPHEEINLSRFVNTGIRRQILKTMLIIMREFSYCSIANQYCIMMIDQIKTLFDVIDVVTLQKFVIREFRERHQLLYDLHKYNKARGSNDEVKRYQINHMNMQSAQVNQMTTQLKDKVQQMQDFYKDENVQIAKTYTGSELTYNDLISSEDREFWQYLCKKDFRRLEKLQTQNIGEGHFMDDTDEDESEGEESARDDLSEDAAHEEDRILGFLERKRGHIQKGRNSQRNNQEQQEKPDEDDDDFDHSSFIESMLNTFSDQQNQLQKQIQEQEEQQELERQKEESKFGANQFWDKNGGFDDQYDIDKLMDDMA